MYGVPAGLCFSLPVMCLGDGNIQVYSGFELSEHQKVRIQ